MAVLLKLNCHTCSEGIRGLDTHFKCKAARYHSGLPDPAFDWLVRNIPNSESGICSVEADGCPCYRVAADTVMGSYYEEKRRFHGKTA